MLDYGGVGGVYVGILTFFNILNKESILTAANNFYNRYSPGGLAGILIKKL